MNSRHLVRRLLRIICFAWLAWLSTSGSGVIAGPIMLVTAQEAGLPPDSAPPTTRGILRGPGIKILSPGDNAIGAAGSFKLRVRFEPRHGHPVDPASVTLVYLRGGGIDITSRIREGISSDGIDVGEALVPAGEHQFRLTLKDVDGRSTSSLIRVKVAPR